MKELAGGGKPAAKAPKLSMAEQRMKALMGGNKSTKSEDKKPVKAESQQAGDTGRMVGIVSDMCSSADGSDEEEQVKQEILSVQELTFMI